MEGKIKKGIALGIVLLFLSSGLLAATPNEKINTNEDENIIIQFSTSGSSNERSIGKKVLQSDNAQHSSNIFEKKISISKDNLNIIRDELEQLKKELQTVKNQNEKIRIYSDCLKILRDNRILPEEFTMEMIVQSVEEFTLNLYKHKNMLPNVIKNRLPATINNLVDKQIVNTNKFTYENNVNPGEFRLDFASAFFVLALLSEMIPFNIVPNPDAFGEVINLNLIDFPIGQVLVDLFPDSELENVVFPVGWVLRPFGYAEFLFIPGNAIIGGQTLFSWPEGIPMHQFFYSGSSLIIPIAFATISLTILLDRGPNNVQVPLFDFGIFLSTLTVHMPYARVPNP